MKKRLVYSLTMDSRLQALSTLIQTTWAARGTVPRTALAGVDEVVLKDLNSVVAGQQRLELLLQQAEPVERLEQQQHWTMSTASFSALKPVDVLHCLTMSTMNARTGSVPVQGKRMQPQKQMLRAQKMSRQLGQRDPKQLVTIS